MKADPQDYTVLARKYRPQTFDELVGQEHVAKTLGNAIASNRVAHAFLFTGVRGVGKTTSARLLAKSLNCERGPSIKPCNECPICVDITSGRDIDVLEIDGASNNSVEDVRRLQETLPYRPQRARLKVVIVDEVHMLSTAAFNAFLKTLEEPPPHVKFIFATTEAHKVPVTIRSRCQRYDFRLIPQKVIGERVREILSREGVDADDDTIALVAREAAGSMRDALTLLDQIVALGGEKLIGSEVAESLGLAGRAELRAVMEGLVRGDARAILERIAAVIQKGLDLQHFTRELTSYARDLTVLKVTSSDASLVDLVDEEREVAIGLVEATDVLELQRLFAGLVKLQDEIARSSAPHLALEMGLVRLATRPSLRSVGELLARLEALEGRLTGGPGDRGGRGGPAAPSAPARTGSREEFITSAGQLASPEIPSEAKAQWEQAPSPAEERNSPAESRSGKEPMGSAPPFDLSTLPPSVRAALEISQGVARKRESRPPGTPAPKAPSNHEADAEGETSGRSVRPEPSSSIPPPRVEPSSEGGFEGGGVPRVRRSTLQTYEEIVDRLERDHPGMLGAIFREAEPVVVHEEKIILAFSEGSFFGDQAGERAHRETLLDVAEQVLGQRPELEIRRVPEIDPSKTLAGLSETRKRSDEERRRREALEHPRVLDALDVFPEARRSLRVEFEDGSR